jgi:hypothetical protein
LVSIGYPLLCLNERTKIPPSSKPITELLFFLIQKPKVNITRLGEAWTGRLDNPEVGGIVTLEKDTAKE